MNAIVRDPVCRLEIEREHASGQRAYGDEIYWFCSPQCAALFDAGPSLYLPPVAERDRHQLAIIGGGPAGLTAALYASIQRLEAILISDQMGGQAADSVAIENYMGFQIIEGPDLVTRFRSQLIQSRFVQHQLDRATELTVAQDQFHIHTRRGRIYDCDAVILAMGMKHRMLGVPGEERLLHRGVSFSVVQDEGRFHGCDIAVVGGGNSALQAASQLAGIGCHLYLIAVGELNGDEGDIVKARALTNLTILEHTKVREVLGSERVEGIRIITEGGSPREIKVGGVFVEIGYTPDSALAAGLIERTPRDEIMIGRDCSTRTPGLFAAGDITDCYGKRVAVACGEGAKAALAAYAYLRQKAKPPAVDSRSPV